MNYFSKIKLGAWLVIILTAINIATFATILYKNHKEKCKVEKKEEMRSKRDRFRYFLKEEVKLTESQRATYDSSLCNYFERSVNIFYKQEALRLKVIEELSTENPDTAELFSLSNAMGENYIQLKKDLIVHFVNCRKLCNPEQKKMLNPLYPILIGPEGSYDIKKKEAFCDKNGKANTN